VKTPRWTIGTILLLSPLFFGCNMALMTANMTVDVMWEASASVPEENDVALADVGIASNLKMMEGLARVSPENPKLFRMLSEGFSSYSFGFLEPKTWVLTDEDDPKYVALSARIKEFHSRATRYARVRLTLLVPEVEARLEGSTSALEGSLKEDFDDDELDAIFWMGHCWSLLVAADPEDLSNVAAMGTITSLLNRVYKDKPSYEDGGLAAYFATSHSVMGPGIAGDLAPAGVKYDEAIKVTDGKYLLPLFLKGLHFCRASSDKACFVTSMKAVIAADPNELPRRRLTNVLAQNWAKHWLSQADSIFD
jgi:hypothetical protein